MAYDVLDESRPLPVGRKRPKASAVAYLSNGRSVTSANALKALMDAVRVGWLGHIPNAMLEVGGPHGAICRAGCPALGGWSAALFRALAGVLFVAGGRATLQAAALAFAGGEAHARRGNGFGRADVAFGSDFLGHGEFQKWGWTNPLLGHTAHAGPWRGLHAWAERTRMSFDPP